MLLENIYNVTINILTSKIDVSAIVLGSIRSLYKVYQNIKNDIRNTAEDLLYVDNAPFLHPTRLKKSEALKRRVNKCKWVLFTPYFGKKINQLLFATDQVARTKRICNPNKTDYFNNPAKFLDQEFNFTEYNKNEQK